MKAIIFLSALLFALTNLLQAQHKTITVYFNDGSSTVLDLANSDSIVVFVCGENKIGYAGKYYGTVLIGDQCWLKENLDVGIMISGTSEQTSNSTIEKYCCYDVLNNCNVNGGLYQWDEAMQYITTEGAQGICPDGWHIPTLAEFQTLSAEVGGDGNALIAIGQGSGTNTSGFSALMTGFRIPNGEFHNCGFATHIWSSTESSASTAYYMPLSVFTSGIFLSTYSWNYGFSVRCIKD